MVKLHSALPVCVGDLYFHYYLKVAQDTPWPQSLGMRTRMTACLQCQVSTSGQGGLGRNG